MNLGIITFIAEDQSHGYLYKLDNLEENYVFDTLKKHSKDVSYKFNPKRAPSNLERYQLVTFNESTNNKSGKLFAKIESTDFRAVLKKESGIFKVLIVDFDKVNYILETISKEFSDIESSIVKFQLSAKLHISSIELLFKNVNIENTDRDVYTFWTDRFIKLGLGYNKESDIFLTSILESILIFLQTKYHDKLDIHQLLSKSILNIVSQSQEYDYYILAHFIRFWKEKYPDFFSYSNLTKVLKPNNLLKTFLWIIDLYSFEELYPEGYSITTEITEYVAQLNIKLQHRYLTLIKSEQNALEHIQKILFNSMPKELPSELEKLNNWVQFVTDNFPNLRLHYLEKLKQGRSPRELIILWRNKIIDLPSLLVFKEYCDSADDETKINILNSVPIPYAIALLNSSLKDITSEGYYNILSKLLRKFVSDSNIIVLDLEYDGYNIKEIAYTSKDDIVTAIKSGDVDNSLKQLGAFLLSSNCFVAGHNIVEYDIPILKEKIELPDNIKFIDTLLLETILSPTIKSFALNTKHNAQDDVEHTLNLLISQLIRLIHIPEKQLKIFEHFIDIDFINLLYQLREYIAESPTDFCQFIESEKSKYFISKDNLNKKTEEFHAVFNSQISEPSVIISPKELYPVLVNLPNIQFDEDNSEFSRVVSEKKVDTLQDGSLEKYLLTAFIEKCKAENKFPIYSNLPGRIKKLLNKNIAVDYITEVSVFSTPLISHFCLSLSKFMQVIPIIKKYNYPVILIESDLLSVTHKILLKTLDYSIFSRRLNSDSFWIYFTGGQSRVSISRDDLIKLQIENIPDYYDNFWVEKTSFDSFNVWGNFNFNKLIREIIGESKVVEYKLNRDELIKDNCFYVIPTSNSEKLSITRYNPETRYRDRYWTYQTILVKHIIAHSTKPTVMIINHNIEKQRLYDYFISCGFYVPDFHASLMRQVNLLIKKPTKVKLLIITQEEVAEIILSEDLRGFNYVIDSFELEDKWFISYGTGLLSQTEKSEVGLTLTNNELQNTLTVQDIDKNEIEDSTLLSSDKDIYLLLKIQKPVVDYYRWLFSLNDYDSSIWLTDSRLANFSGLEDEWKAVKKYIATWNDNSEYEKDYNAIKSFFPSPKPKGEINIDIDSAKEALRDIFLKDESGNVCPWYHEQESYLDEIIPAEKDILVTMPTGGGKSVLFQAPALYRGSITGRLTIVVTPLKALMEDHVSKLWDLKLWGSVEYINRDRIDVQLIYRRIAGGEILLLYITPERFRSKSFINALKMRLENDGGFEYIVFDEAHCISQWGLDFRPDYLNCTNVNIALKERSISKFPLLFFSATVSEQIYKDFQSRFNNSINRLNNYSNAYNPLREHISINFETSEDSEMKLNQIAESLYNDNFDPELSRCLVFVRRRKDAEENVNLLEKQLNNVFGKGKFTGRVAYFHAGMNAEERHEVYSAYKSGEVSILLATKAFGMGMDIPNVHYIYHFGPSGTIEDYLQEVGRAGRNAKQLNDAGFSAEKPIQTKCFLEKNDFKYLKTLLQNNRITWTNLIMVYTTILDYYSRHRDFDTHTDKPIVLPLNILIQSSTFIDIQDKDQLLRLSLYWLEKLERIKLGFYAPAQLEFSKFIKPPHNRIESEEQRILFEEVEKAWKQKDNSSKAVSIELNKLLNMTGFSNSSDLLKMIYKCQKNKIFCFENNIIMYPTQKKMDELKYFIPAPDLFGLGFNTFKKPYYPTVEAVFDLSIKLMSMVREKEQEKYDGDVLEELKRIVSGEYFNENTFPWCKKNGLKENETINDRIKKEQKDFDKNKVKFAFTLASFIPKVRHQTLITHKLGEQSKVLQIIYNGCKQKEEWLQFLMTFKKDLISLLSHVTQTYISQGENGKRYNLSNLLIVLKLENKNTEYLENLFSLAKWLGYMHYEGSFLPMGVELYLHSRKEILHEESNSLDKQIHEEFHTTQKLRELRLITLECLSGIEIKQEKDKFITEYFACSDSAKITSLLVKHLGEGHAVLKGFRDEALKQIVFGEETENGERKGGLSDEQLKVYEADIRSNVQVIAGPGSGKTHTLILRVARLIHNENIFPENILVLAYNRAVVVELKSRLTELFNSLGYANIIHRLKVFTFHGFCKYILKNSIQNVPLDSWISEFVNTARNQPGIISNRLGIVKYVLVDEFQDITNERLELLKLIANPNQSFVTVIGDPNQSIYGYERVYEGGTRSPRENYNKYAEHYKPLVLPISINYRSYPRILSTAEKFLSHNKDRFNLAPLRPVSKAKHNYSEIIPCDGINNDWLDKLVSLIEEVNPETGNKYRQIAIMFRRNTEVYRAYSLIEKFKEEKTINIRLRIQGENDDFSRTREIAWIIDNYYKPKIEERIILDFIDQFRNYKNELMRIFPNWDFYYFNLFECLLHEYYKQREEDSTYNDLLEFINELTEKDDGQLSRIYYNNIRKVIGEDSKTEIVLTTMHKVKGLEFDAVLIPSSFTNLPIKDSELNLDKDAYRELIEEERRLTYVAYTRAKYRLVAYYGNRERAVIEGKSYVFPDEVINNLGIAIPEGLEKYFISWGATESGNSVFSTIEQNLKYGSIISLKRATNNWFLFLNDVRLSCLSNNISEYLSTKANGSNIIDGFRVSNIHKWTLEDTTGYDLKHNSDYEKHWSKSARQRGYIYLIEFSGFGQMKL